MFVSAFFARSSSIISKFSFLVANINVVQPYYMCVCVCVGEREQERNSVCVHENSKKFIFITIPKPRGIPPSVCSGTSNLENPMQKAEPSLGALALRTRGGRLKSSFLPWELSLPTQVAHGYGYPHIIQIINYSALQYMGS